MSILNKSHIVLAVATALTAISLLTSCQNATPGTESSSSALESGASIDLAKQEELRSESTLIGRINDLKDTQKNLTTISSKLSEIALLIHHLAVTLDETEELRTLKTELESTSGGFSSLAKLIERSSTNLRTHHFQTNSKTPLDSTATSGDVFFSLKVDSNGNELNLIRSTTENRLHVARMIYNSIPFAEFTWDNEGFKGSAFDLGGFLDSIKIDTEQSQFAKFCQLNTGESPLLELVLDCKLDLSSGDSTISTEAEKQNTKEARIRLSKSAIAINDVTQEIEGISTLLTQLPSVLKTKYLTSASPKSEIQKSEQAIVPTPTPEPTASPSLLTQSEIAPESSPTPSIQPSTDPTALSSSNPTTEQVTQ